MSESLSGAATSLHRVAEMLGEARGRIGAVDLDPRSFGAGGAGRLGDLGQDLHLLWLRAADARVREAVAHAARVREAGDAVGRAAGAYTDIDESARRGQSDPQSAVS